MKLLGRDIDTDTVMAYVSRRLSERGLAPTSPAPGHHEDGVEPRVDPLAFNLASLAEHADATRGLPVESHRPGLSGLAVTLAKRAFRTVGQVFINEALARQSAFNGHVRDSYAQLSSEVVRLRARVAELEAERAKAPGEEPG